MKDLSIRHQSSENHSILCDIISVSIEYKDSKNEPGVDHGDVSSQVSTIVLYTVHRHVGFDIRSCEQNRHLRDDGSSEDDYKRKHDCCKFKNLQDN